MPLYDLDEVRTAARRQKVEYRGRKVMSNTADLGYEFEDVCACLVRLTKDDFQKSHHYDDGPGDDAYRLRTARPRSDDTEFDELYIKFRLVGDHVTVDLGSFHV
jgi:hypothetical protein